MVTQKENMPQAVLIRAVEPVKGLNLMIRRRKIDVSKKSMLKNLTNGPSKLCHAMGIDTSFNGIDLCRDELFITFENSLDSDKDIVATKRAHIDYAEKYKDKNWRFLLKEMNL